jgi:hypothetical protein
MAQTANYVGSYGRPWLITLNKDSGSDDRTGLVAANISIILRDLTSSPPVDTTSAGTITMASSSPAQITWQPTSADYATAGTFSIYPVVTFGTGPVVYDPIPLIIQTR